MKITKSQLKQIIEEELETTINEAEVDFGRRKFLKTAGQALGVLAVSGLITPSKAATDSPEYRKSFEATAGVYNRVVHDMYKLEKALIEHEAYDLAQRIGEVRDGPWAALAQEITQILESKYPNP